MKHLQTVNQAAKTLNLVDHNGKLIALDSLSVLDLVNELERVTQLSIPTNELRPEAFATFETVAELLDRVTPAGAL